MISLLKCVPAPTQVLSNEPFKLCLELLTYAKNRRTDRNKDISQFIGER